MRRFSFLLLALMLLVSCGRDTVIRGTVEGAAERDIVVRLLNVNVYELLDTVKTSPEGDFVYRTHIEKGHPEFIYLFYGDTRIASLLLEKGDRVSIVADTLGFWTVEGSEECERLRAVEMNLADFTSSFTRTVNSGESQAITREYLDYYRTCVRHIVENPYSMTCIPVLYQQIAVNLPVFSQVTDAIHFRRVCDSLKTVYPDSRYVKALEKETVRREQYMNMNNMLSGADEVGFPDLNMPSVNGEKVALSSLDAKVVMVHFWTAADAPQKMFNLDVLKPIYEKYRARGFEIYAVCIDTDKAAWASTVKAQQLPWINVNDGLGTSSTSLALYNVTELPQSILIVDGELAEARIAGEDGLRRTLDRLLK